MATELDYMEYANDADAQAAYVSSDFEPGAWDLLDEDCADISDWNDGDLGNGVSEVSPAGQFRMDCNTATTPNSASRNRDIGSYPNTWTAEIKLYHDSLGALSDGDWFKFEMRRNDIRIYILFASEGLYVDNGAGVQLILADAVKYGGSAAWQIWRFVIDATVVGSATMDIYLDTRLVASNVDCSFGASMVDGYTVIVQQGLTTNDMLIHIDYIKMATGLEPPDLQCYSEDTIKQEGSYSLKGVARITGSLNDTLTRTVAPTIDLSGLNRLHLDIYSSRTGSNVKIGIRDSGGVTTELTPNISSANGWEHQRWDVSGVADADKNAIDSIIITVVNADADNTFYIDFFFGGSIPKGLADTLACTDDTIKKTSRTLADTLAFTDTIVRKTKRVLADTLAFTDSITKKAKKVLADTLAFTDVVFKKMIFLRAKFADTLAFTDSITKKASKSLVDTLAFTDSIVKKSFKVLSDALSFTTKLIFWGAKGVTSTSWTDVSVGDSSWTDVSVSDTDWKDV